MAKGNWGGVREGAGRPLKEAKRTRRAIEYFDTEWDLIKENAKKRNIPVREYLYWLVEHDPLADKI
jgi:hypothetical protein